MLPFLMWLQYCINPYRYALMFGIPLYSRLHGNLLTSTLCVVHILSGIHRHRLPIHTSAHHPKLKLYITHRLKALEAPECIYM